jgi:serine/threonine-protein kinase
MKMDPETWQALSELLDQWMEQPEEHRAEWLEGLGPEHERILPVLRQVIGKQAAIDSAGFLNTLPEIDGPPNLAAGWAAQPDAGLTAGALVGPYRLLRELGQGGMGVVWLAERADGAPKRPVALKLPILSLHDRTMADRFARERDILAQLAHPCIARLYDAGVTHAGQPYFA